jgi:hypothetical protein
MLGLCTCRRPLLGGGAAMLALGAAGARAQGTDHAALLARLRQGDLLDPYALEPVREIAAALGRAMGVRGGVAVNEAPRGADGILVCVLRAARDRRAPLPDDVAQDPPPASPVAEPARRVIWVNADFLRTLAVQISLFGNAAWGGGGLTGIQAVARSRLEPPPGHERYWNPETSPAFRHPTLGLVARGAAGFVLAHEIAHVLLGEPPSVEAALRGLPRRARQLAPMCPSLTLPAVVKRRAYEDAADARALEAVLAGGPALGQGPVGLPGELGIATLFTLRLGDDIVRVGSTVNTPIPRRLLEAQVGPEMFARLRADAAPRPGTDLVGLIYSDTHPAVVERLLGVMRRLAKRPGSQWQGDADPARSQAVWLQLVQMSCDEALRGTDR